MAVYTPKNLVPVTQLTATAVTQYTTPSVTTAVIRTIWANTATAARTVTVSTGTDGSATRLLDAYALTVTVPAIFNVWVAIPTTTTIQALASNATSVNLQISGYEYA